MASAFPTGAIAPCGHTAKPEAAAVDECRRKQLLYGIEVMCVLHFFDSGAHQGEFAGIPPANKEVTIDVVDIFGVEDGDCREELWFLLRPT